MTHRESFGGGDIKLMAALGLFLGADRGLICLLAACVLSLLYALIARIARSVIARRRGGTSEEEGEGLLRTTLPFAPFIALGALIAFVV